jgi:hypothetical protein
MKQNPNKPQPRMEDQNAPPLRSEIVVRAEIMPPEKREVVQTGNLRSIMDTIDGLEAFVIEVLNAGLIDKHVEMVRFAQPVRDGQWSENDVIVLSRVATTVANLMTRINRTKRRGDQARGPLTIEQAEAQIVKLQEEIATKRDLAERARRAWQNGGVNRRARDAETA